jgi:hypothetical protein
MPGVVKKIRMSQLCMPCIVTMHTASQPTVDQQLAPLLIDKPGGRSDRIKRLFVRNFDRFHNAMDYQVWICI